MKRMYKISIAYLVYGLAVGIFCHEAAYWTHFQGYTVLSKVHPHALALGAGVFLLMPLLMKTFAVEKEKSFRWFLWFYNIGLVMTLGFMTVRGTIQLFGIAIPSYWDHMIGGFAGIGHILLTVGLFALMRALMRSAKE